VLSVHLRYLAIEDHDYPGLLIGCLYIHEIGLCIYDADAIRQLETWMLRLKTDCSSRKLLPKSAFGLIESVGRLLAPLLC
jgi:hypothetical protein